MKSTGPLGHVKRTAKRIKKKYPHVPLMAVQHDLARYLGFSKWGSMLEASPIELQKQITAHPLEGL